MNIDYYNVAAIIFMLIVLWFLVRVRSGASEAKNFIIGSEFGTLNTASYGNNYLFTWNGSWSSDDSQNSGKQWTLTPCLRSPVNGVKGNLFNGENFTIRIDNSDNALKSFIIKRIAYACNEPIAKNARMMMAIVETSEKGQISSRMQDLFPDLVMRKQVVTKPWFISVNIPSKSVLNFRPEFFILDNPNARPYMNNSYIALEIELIPNVEREEEPYKLLSM